MELAHINRLKGLAILVMVIGHVYLFVLGNHQGPINRLITCNMPLFMFLSGIVIKVPPSPLKWANKAFRFMSPSVFAGIICFLLIGIHSSFINTTKALLEFFYIPSRGYWYLVVLTIFYATLTLIGLFKKRSFLWNLVLTICFYAFFFFSWKLGGKIGENFCMEHCTCYYPFFMMGYFARAYCGGTGIFLRNNSIFSISLFCLFLFFLTDSDTYIIKNIVNRFLLPTSAIIVSVILFAEREAKKSKIESILEFFGKNSLNIYLWHGIFLNQVHLLCLKHFFEDGKNVLLEFMIALCLGLILTLLSVYFGIFILKSEFIRKYCYGYWAKNVGR